MTHVSSSSYDTCPSPQIRESESKVAYFEQVLQALIREGKVRDMYPPPHMTHVSSSSYDTCILLLI
jgi:hypothetical protein